MLDAMRRSAEKAGATWLRGSHHKFEPQGVTAVGLLSESHISMHTWPELGYAACDVFTCGDHTDPRLACEMLAREMGAESYTLRMVERAARLRLTPEGFALSPDHEPGTVFTTA